MGNYVLGTVVAWSLLFLSPLRANVFFTWQMIDDLGNVGMESEPNGQFSTVVSMGSVSYAYAAAKHEVSVAQYTVFLNRVARYGDVYQLWDPRMETYVDEAKGIDHRVISREGSGTSGDPYIYKSMPGRAQSPVIFVSWSDAARFVNWLQNGQGPGGTERGVYDMSMLFPQRAPGATVFLPTHSEWHKAAYYDPRTPEEGGPGAIPHYWRYPQATDDDPVAAILDEGAIINASPGVKLTNFRGDGPQGHCNVDAGGSSAESPYGVMHMGGNVVEWTEDRLNDFANADPPKVDIRGGDWGNSLWDQQNVNINAATAARHTTDNGFRVFALPAFALDPMGGIDPDADGPGDTPLGEPFEVDDHTIALYHLDGDGMDASGNGFHLTPVGDTTFRTDQLEWMWQPSGGVVEFLDETDQLHVSGIPDSMVLPEEGSELTIEWQIKKSGPIETHALGDERGFLLFRQNYDTFFQMRTHAWSKPYAPTLIANASSAEVLTRSQSRDFLHDGNFSAQWMRVKMVMEADGAIRVWVNGRIIPQDLSQEGNSLPPLPNWDRDQDWSLTLGGFPGYMDEVRISRGVRPRRVGSDPIGMAYESYATWIAETLSIDSGNPMPDLDPSGNDDADEANNLFEFLARTHPADGSDYHLPNGLVVVEEAVAGIHFSYRRPRGGLQETSARYAVGELTCHLEITTDLTDPEGWAEHPALWEMRGVPVDNGDGTEDVTFRLTPPESARTFVRLRVVYLPEAAEQ